LTFIHTALTIIHKESITKKQKKTRQTKDDRRAQQTIEQQESK